MGGKFREISHEVRAKAEKAEQEIGMMLDAAEKGQWNELLDVGMSPEDVQYLSQPDKDKIAKTRELFNEERKKLADEGKSEKLDLETANRIEDVLHGFETALN